MPEDLREQFEEVRCGTSEPIKKEVSEKTLLNDLILCGIKLQANHMCRDALEDQMNDYVRDLLDAMGYVVRDQTRQGTSSEGRQAGEVDILVKSENTPFSILEALRLSSVDTAYMATHIEKIYGYDTAGNKCNFIISYVKTERFAEFWRRYVEFVKSYNYPFPQTNFMVLQNSQYSELKCAVTTLKRSGVSIYIT